MSEPTPDTAPPEEPETPAPADGTFAADQAAAAPAQTEPAPPDPRDAELDALRQQVADKDAELQAKDDELAAQALASEQAADTVVDTEALPAEALGAHSGRRLAVDKDFKPHGNHDDTIAADGRLYCSTCLYEWPCPSATPE